MLIIELRINFRPVVPTTMLLFLLFFDSYKIIFLTFHIVLTDIDFKCTVEVTAKCIVYIMEQKTFQLNEKLSQVKKLQSRALGSFIY